MISNDRRLLLLRGLVDAEAGGGGGGRVPVSIGAPQAVGSKRTRDDSSSGSNSSEVKIKKEKIR